MHECVKRSTMFTTKWRVETLILRGCDLGASERAGKWKRYLLIPGRMGRPLVPRRFREHARSMQEISKRYLSAVLADGRVGFSFLATFYGFVSSITRWEKRSTRRRMRNMVLYVDTIAIARTRLRSSFFPIREFPVSMENADLPGIFGEYLPLLIFEIDKGNISRRTNIKAMR